MKIFFRSAKAAVPFIFLLVAVFAVRILHTSAAGLQPTGPDRFTIVKQEYTGYEWWLTGWTDNQVACSIVIDHDGKPSPGEIKEACGTSLYEKWLSTKPCETSEENPSICKGYYLLFFKSWPAQRDLKVVLPPPVIWVSLDGCVSYNSTYQCDALPTLVLTGEEPLQGEHITSLVVQMNGKTFSCDDICQVDLAPTNNDGLFLEFWANSSYGDTSVIFNARVRVEHSGDSTDNHWFVDILSSQWRGEPLAGCSQTWGTFPPIGGVPLWLSTPGRADDLETKRPYDYLSAKLITLGMVDASSCSDGGLLEGGVASPCGLEAAKGAVVAWQNQFNDLIFNAANQTGIPAHLLKRIFSRESQFWPGMTIGHPEAGLGQMTVGGADTTLLWNRPFYEQFCPSVLDGSACRLGYPHLDRKQQDKLRNDLVSSVNAFCPDCQMGIDMQRAENSVSTFAETIVANCVQTGMVVDLNNRTNSPVAFEDLWRFTLVNYNAGPGCLGLAVDATSRLAEPLDWKHLSTHLTPVCQGALEYVTDISGVAP